MMTTTISPKIINHLPPQKQAVNTKAVAQQTFYSVEESFAKLEAKLEEHYGKW